MRYANAENSVIADGNRCIPVDPANADYQAILESGAEIEPYEAPAASRVVDARAFMDLFEPAVLVGIAAAKRTDAALEIFWTRAVAGPVDLDSAETIAGLTYLVDVAHLLTAERAAIIRA